MIRYFFKLAFRNIRKYKVNTLISLLGLIVGLASFILIASYIRYELSFNTFNENYNRIYVAKINAFRPSGMVQGTHFPYPLVESLVTDFPEVECGVRFTRIYSQLSNGDISFFEDNASYVDNSFFKIFTVKFLSGDKVNPLNEPYTIVLNETTAKKYFGTENPIGKSLLLEGKHNLKVTAVIEDLPANSDFNYDLFVSMKTKVAMNSEKDYSQAWGGYFFPTIFMLDKNCDVKKLNEKISGYFDKRDDEKTKFFLSPLSTFHLKPNLNNNSLKVLVIFGLVAIFILIIACINFINLSIANAANRVKEISIRRIVGSKKSSLIFQQIGESVLLAFISFDLAYLLAERLFSNFNAILGTQIPLKEILSLTFIIGMFLTALLLGVISGIFPAIRISRIQPLQALTGKRTNLGRIGIGKKALIVMQYAVSVILIISTILLYQQFNYIKNMDLGFNKAPLLSLYVGNEGGEKTTPKLKSFKDEVSKIAGVQNIALSTRMPFYGNSGTSIKKENAPKEETYQIDYSRVEASFFDTYGIEIISKKEISENNISSETRYCYINQTAANVLGFENPIGERIVIWEEKYEIIGVYKDFHNYTVQQEIPSQVLILAGDADQFPYYNWMVAKCDLSSLNKIKELATKVLREMIPDNPYSFFSYGNNEFKEETLNNVKGIEKTFGIFTFIAIVIAAMGIFGLVALTVKHKTKEIGIRKTLGSSVFAIYKLIAKEYIFLAIIGNVMAWVPAWYIINKILQDFAYRIEINLWVFVLGFIASMLLTFTTIAFHTIKAARTNPVEALRYE